MNGKWGEWHAWGACSASCGVGTRTRVKQCDGPEKANGGLDCVGSPPTEEGNCRTKICKMDVKTSGKCETLATEEECMDTSMYPDGKSYTYEALDGAKSVTYRPPGCFVLVASNKVSWNKRPITNKDCTSETNCLCGKKALVPTINNDKPTINPACITLDKDFNGDDLSGNPHTNIQTWGDCSKLCRSTSGCVYWTYGDTVYHGNCWLKRRGAVNNKLTHVGLISGPKTCVGIETTKKDEKTDEDWSELLEAFSEGY